jgi:serine/threonine protein kinase
VITELMDTDLHQIIRTDQVPCRALSSARTVAPAELQGLTRGVLPFKVLSDDHLQYFMYQILRGIKYIHSFNVVLRSPLNPES